MVRVVNSSMGTNAFDRRISMVRSEMGSRDFDCLLVTHGPNVQYLTGFAGTSGWTLVMCDDVAFITDARYADRVRLEQPWLRVELATDGLTDATVRMIAASAVRRLGIEGEYLPYSRVQTIRTALAEPGRSCDVRSAAGIVESLRMIKDDHELDAIRRASVLADRALTHAHDCLIPGMTETEVAWLIERWLRENGSDAVLFPVMVASGPNSAIPHARPSDRVIERGEPIIIDLGARVEGYCSDLTRTLFLGHMPSEYERLYQTVLSAHRAVLHGIHSGLKAAEADELARRIVRDSPYDGMFTHGLGHGVGLEIHEAPTLNGRSPDVLTDSMVFTVEPGIYVVDFGGVRIEDTVVLRDGSAVSLARFDKEDPVVHCSKAV